MASWLPVSGWTGGCVTRCTWLLYVYVSRRSGDVGDTTRNGMTCRSSRSSMMSPVHAKTCGLPRSTNSSDGDTSPPQACTHPRPCVGLTMAGVPLEMAFKRLSLRSARLCRQCRRSFASTASGRESQSATRAFSGMPCIQRPRSERPANRPPQSTFNPLEPNLRQRHSQIALQTLPPPPPFHQPPSHLPNPPPLPRDNAHPPTSPAT